MRKSKKFHKCKVPRYLPGSVTRVVLIKDLKQYNKHLFNVFYATPKVDDLPPKINPFVYLNKKRLSDDADRLIEIDKQNKQLLRAINKIHLTTGKVDSFNPAAYSGNSKWKSHKQRLRKIEQENKEIYRTIKAAHSHYAVKELERLWQITLGALKSKGHYPFVILQKVPPDQLLKSLPSISGNLEKITKRPCCFLEFQVKNGPNLGRIIIELYFDHVPVTVQNFLTLCNPNEKLSYKNCRVHRIVRGQFIETGDITKGTGRGGISIYGPSFAEESHVLKHTKPGVLSMVRRGLQENNSIFNITFTDMERLDKQNVVFGKIIAGIDHFLKIEGYGRRIGKPLEEIYISNCGSCENKS